MITFLLVIAIVAVSAFAFQRPQLVYRLAFIPYQIAVRKEYYRFVTHLFVHADWLHLALNVLVLYSFGRHVEAAFRLLWGPTLAALYYLALFFLGGALASLSSYYRHRHNPAYISVGASGAVSAVLATSVILNPWAMVYVWFIPMPAIVMAVLYLGYSWYMARRGQGNINHDAHFWGTVFGLLFPIVVEPRLALHFIRMLLYPLTG